MKITTNRLIIRPLVSSDKLDLFEYRSDSKTNQYQGWIPKTIGDVEAFIDKLPAKMNVPDTWFQLAIVEAESKKMIGDIGVHFFAAKQKQVEIGYTLNKAFKGRGFAVESLRGTIDFLFTELGKRWIVAMTHPQNTSSIRLLERLGFSVEPHPEKFLDADEMESVDLVYVLSAE